MNITPVQLESPFAGNIKRNIAYARACMRDCLLRSEAPFASHLLYTQVGVLDDDDKGERKLGIEAGLAIGAMFRRTVVYTDLGISEGMRRGIDAAKMRHRTIVYRSLGDKWKIPL